MNSIYVSIIKRLLDIIFSILGLLLLSPVLIICILLLRFSNNGHNVFFTQYRPGKNEKLFKIIKLKTMTDKRDGNGNLLPDVARLTKIGKFVRSASIDELPQLVNILKGDMSFVGPRPLLVEYLDLYSDEQRRRHEVKPGLTGWSQVNGRNAISWKTKFEYDLWYVENISFTTDLNIIFKTIAKVLRMKDVNSGAGLTMAKFNGNN
jgi:undecaprenyl phosphate N,N'-diacetylbacillosamine 1-phosphate transferase